MDAETHATRAAALEAEIVDLEADLDRALAVPPAELVAVPQPEV